VSALVHLPKRLLVGRPLESFRLGETLLPKRLALPVFCSDPLSSNAYATEEILLVLSLGGVGLLHLTPWVAAGVVFLLVVVVASYRQTCYAYPSGGGAYAVSRANLGRSAALVAASALLVDYVLTVAVSVAAGVANVVSAFPGLSPYAVPISVGAVTVLALVNLRGVKESGTAFAVPTYGFVACVLTMLGLGVAETLRGRAPVAESAHYATVSPGHLGGLVLLVLVLRAFASGCTALTGVEAVSNGVPGFRKPKSRNAARTLTAMGAITVVMFVGITALALGSGVHMAQDPATLAGAPAGYEQKTVIAQLGAAVFGAGSFGFFALQAFTAAILVLAANTAFNGFPILASILAEDGYLPRQLSRRGDRLVFSNGILILAAVAAGLIMAFDASTTRLIQLYIIGVFVAFTLSQAGMVRHWLDQLSRAQSALEQRRIHYRMAVNAVGAATTALVLVIVLLTKFTHGAWLVVIAMPLVFLVMHRIRDHYLAVADELRPDPRGVTLPARIHVLVLVSRLHTPALRALAFARATRPASLTAVTVRTNPVETEQLVREWTEREVPVDLTVLDSPYRDLVRPVLERIAEIRDANPRDVVSVYIPEYVVGRWWENALHNQSALRLKARLLFEPRVMVTDVPWQLGSVRGEAAPEPGKERLHPVAR